MTSCTLLIPLSFIYLAVQTLLDGDGLNTPDRVTVLDGGPALMGRTKALLPKANILRCSRHLQVIICTYPLPNILRCSRHLQEIICTYPLPPCFRPSYANCSVGPFVCMRRDTGGVEPQVCFE